MDMNCNYVEEVSSVTLNHTKSIDKQPELIKINLPLTDDEKQTSETDDHSTDNSLILNSYRAFDEPRSIISVNGANALGVDDIYIIGRIEGHEVCITLKNVLYIPTSPVRRRIRDAKLDGLRIGSITIRPYTIKVNQFWLLDD